MISGTEIYNYSMIRDKLFNNLVSIIDGVLSDGKVNDIEIVYLATWLREAEEISSNQVVRSLLFRVNNILSEGKLTVQEKEDIKTFLSDIQRELLDVPNIDFYSAESDINLLTGLCKGIAADRSISEEEIRYLNWWLRQNSTLKNNYPGKDLYKLVKEILADKVVTEEESRRLYNAICAFSGANLDDGVVEGLSTRLPCDEIDSIDFSGSTFCLTGTFLCGNRSVISQRIVDAGGDIKDSITKKINYLVVGTLSSKAWRFSAHGRKIEKAISYRDELLTGIKIITEDDLIRFLPAS